MNRHFIKIYFTLLFLTTKILFGQSAQDLKLPQPKRLIDKIEVFAAPCLYFPNDHGWSDYVYNGSQGQTIYKAEKKKGYFFGVNIIHSIGKQFELQGRFAFEKRGYYENYVSLDNTGNPYSESEIEQKNNYLTFSLVPAINLLKQNRLQVFTGFTYGFLTKSIAFGKNYTNGQYIGSASINTIDGFKRHVVDALIGVGYFFPFNRNFDGIVRVQGNYGLSYTANQNDQSISINSISFSLAIRYSR